MQNFLLSSQRRWLDTYIRPCRTTSFAGCSIALLDFCAYLIECFAALPGEDTQIHIKEIIEPGKRLVNIKQIRAHFRRTCTGDTFGNHLIEVGNIKVRVRQSLQHIIVVSQFDDAGNLGPDANGNTKEGEHDAICGKFLSIPLALIVTV